MCRPRLHITFKLGALLNKLSVAQVDMTNRRYMAACRVIGKRCPRPNRRAKRARQLQLQWSQGYNYDKTTTKTTSIFYNKIVNHIPPQCTMVNMYRLWGNPKTCKPYLLAMPNGVHSSSLGLLCMVMTEQKLVTPVQSPSHDRSGVSD